MSVVWKSSEYTSKLDQKATATTERKMSACFVAIVRFLRSCKHGRKRCVCWKLNGVYDVSYRKLNFIHSGTLRFRRNLHSENRNDESRRFVERDGEFVHNMEHVSTKEIEADLRSHAVGTLRIGRHFISRVLFGFLVGIF